MCWPSPLAAHRPVLDRRSNISPLGQHSNAEGFPSTPLGPVSNSDQSASHIHKVSCSSLPFVIGYPAFASTFLL